MNMLFSTLILSLVLSSSTALADGIVCIDLFAKTEAREQILMKRIFPSYQQYPEIVNLMLRLMNRGVVFQFYNPKPEDSELSRLYVEPIVSAKWNNGQFDAQNIRVSLPKNTTDIEQRSGLYQLLSHLARMNNILAMQKQGALFDHESMFFNHRVTLIGFQKEAQISNWTLGALQHAMITFGIERIGFEPLDSVWAKLGMRPDLRIARNPQYPLELLVRSYYFERADSWEKLAAELETGMFTPYGRPFFPSPETPMQ
ncbi:hypothetical protein K2X05_05860 [bacterium]|nr:hypothetical protein [bacterium]